MYPKTILKLAARLFALCVLCAAALLLSTPGERARADAVSCTYQLEICYASCPPLPPDQSLDACRASCEMNYNSCNVCDLQGLPPGCEDPDTIPERWPVVDKGRRCLQSCQIYIYTDPEAYSACKSNCLAMYP